jgi:hypothetical protein
MRGFTCITHGDYGGMTFGADDALWKKGVPPVIMNVQLANSADAVKMRPGKIVTLGGVMRVATENRVNYLIVANAKFLHDDPFAR